MGSILAAIAQGIASALIGPIVQFFQNRALKQQGAADQRAADQKSELEIKDAQLRDAANRPDDHVVDDKLSAGGF